MASGAGRDVAALMRAVPGLLAKDGFEGVQVAALPDGRAVAVKIADGANRARVPVAAAALAWAGVDPALLTEFAGGAAARRRVAGGVCSAGACAGPGSPSRLVPRPDVRDSAGPVAAVARPAAESRSSPRP